MPLFDKLSEKFGELMKDKSSGGPSSAPHMHRQCIDVSQTKKKAVTAHMTDTILNTINNVDTTSSSKFRLEGNSHRTTEDSNRMINHHQALKMLADDDIRYGGGPPGQLPPGWIQQWDANSQRYYYVEQATGRTQWEPPLMYQGAGMHGQPEGYGHEGYRGHDSEGYHGAPYGVHDKKNKEKKKDSSHTGLALAGGALLGAGAGAWAMHEYSELADTN
jgi:hypothetical protein